MLNSGYSKLRKGPKMRLLPESFSPSQHDVVCGRGRNIFMHVGNQSFRQLVASRLQEYSDALTKLEKTRIIGEMVDHVRTNSPHGGFVKRSSKDGRWYQLLDFLSREKISQAFRDSLSDQYRQINDSKKQRQAFKEALSDHYRPINDSKKQRRHTMPQRAVSDATFQASLQAHPSAKNVWAKAQSADNLVGGQSVIADPLFLKNDKEIASYQPPSQICSLRNFEWASKNVALQEAIDEFKRIEHEKSTEIEATESTFKLGQPTEQAVIDDRSIFDRLVLLVDKQVDKQDNGDDPFEPTPLPAQDRYAVYYK
jgi:hypothetical protein